MEWADIYNRSNIKGKIFMKVYLFYTLSSYQTTSSMNYPTFIWRPIILGMSCAFLWSMYYPLLKLIMTSTDWTAVSIISKVIDMTLTWTRDSNLDPGVLSPNLLCSLQNRFCKSFWNDLLTYHSPGDGDTADSLNPIILERHLVSLSVQGV